MTSDSNPYRGLPAYQYWSSGVSNIGLGQFDPVTSVKFRIDLKDTISTLGSCFAQHLARHIQNSGFKYLVTEPLRIGGEQTEISSAMAHQFSARYGNVYTVRQALQLLDRANGWVPEDDIWERDERFYDAFRPNVFPGGFANRDDLIEERNVHLKKVSEVITKSDVIVFTLGLTEAWISRQDGAVYPIAPGVVAGTMNQSKFSFKNFNYDEVKSDLKAWCVRLRTINPTIRILLTVSPVSLNATYENQNVWNATTYSKSVLRAAAGEVANGLPYVDYFPSYEIITCPLMQGRYFEDDMREVKEIGVRHVMRVFEKHYLSKLENTNSFSAESESELISASRSNGVSEIFCDEELLDPN